MRNAWAQLGVLMTKGNGWLKIPAVVALLVVAAWGGGGEPFVLGAGAEAAGPDLSGELEPFVAAIEARVGASLEQLMVAVENAVREHTHQCLTNAGFDLPSPVPRNAPDPVVRVSTAERARQQLTSTGADETPRDAVERRCWQAAIRSTPNPVGSIRAWLDAETAEIYDGVGLDIRVVAARDQYETCIGTHGFESIATAQARLIDSIRETVAAYEAGTLKLVEAEQTLMALESEERAVWNASDTCSAPMMDVERRVAAEREHAWLAENRQRLNEEIDRHLSEIEALTPD